MADTPEKMALADGLLERLEQLGEHPVLIDSKGTVTAAALAKTVHAYAEQAEAAGIRPGDACAIHGDFSESTIAWLLALFLGKAVVVPLTQHNPAELSDRYATASVRWVVTASSPEELAKAEAAPAEPHPLVRELVNRGHAGLILFSSGTTGKPKAMLHDLDRMLASYAVREPRELRLLVFLLFDHIGGLDTLFRALASGTTLIVPDARTPEAVAATIEKQRIQVLPASPTFLTLMLLSGVFERHDLSSLKIIGYGAEPMQEGVLKRLTEALPGVAFQQKFGTSETNAIRVTSAAPDSLLMRIDDPNAEYRIVDGELWLRTGTQILGYLNHETERFTEDGWFKTGDLVEEQEGGYFRITGRTEEVINVGGRKVLPGDVERVILAAPGVRDCMAYGMDNAITGQTVIAEVVPEQDCDPKILRKELLRNCREHLDAYKVPSKIKLVAAIAHSDRFKRVRTARGNNNS